MHVGAKRRRYSAMVLRGWGRKEHSEYVISLTCEDALSAHSLGVLERVHEVRETADGDGT
jgi:hypothetical protein